MKILFDFFPVLLFFVAYKMYGFFVGTAVAIGATFVQVGLFWLKYRRFETTHLVVLAIVTLFGGATLLLDDPIFFKWKPTVAYWLFAAAFLGSQFIGARSITERMMAHVVQAPRPVWIRLNLAWVVFFASMGLLNIYVAYNFSEDTWVNFKLFGILGLTLLFVLAQGVYLARYMNETQAPEEGS